jgi:hypothetical protein
VERKCTFLVTKKELNFKNLTSKQCEVLFPIYKCLKELLSQKKYLICNLKNCLQIITDSNEQKRKVIAFDRPRIGSANSAGSGVFGRSLY